MKYTMIALTIPLALAVAGCGGSDNPDTSVAQTDCQALDGQTILPEQISIPNSGATLSATFSFTSTIAFCNVTAAIAPAIANAPEINVQVNLPVDWNGKGLQYTSESLYGGEQVNGRSALALAPAGSPTPLADEFATFGSDSGHQSPDGSFLADEATLQNFAGNQLLQTRDLAVEVMSRYYSSQPTAIYIQGSEQGGREALIAAQRWPDLYNGVIAINPLTTLVGHSLALIQADQILSEASPNLNFLQISLIASSLQTFCDFNNTATCNEDFDLDSLLCEQVFDPTVAVCLSGSQVDAVDALMLNFPVPTLIDGVSSINGLSLSSTVVRELFDTSSPHFIPAADVAPLIQFGITGTATNQTADTIIFDNQTRISELSNLLDVSADLSEFAANGGKAIVVDQAFNISSNTTTQWHDRVTAQLGAQATEEFLQFIELPEGDSVTFDALSALELLQN